MMTQPQLPALVAVDALPMPPYPADVRARGWAFDLDLERIEHSDTWLQSSVELRPWLLMTWAMSWLQSPCGSLPASDDSVAAIIGMSPTAFATHKATLMRGWVRHQDGRLYHRVLTEMVFAMIGKRKRDRERKALKGHESQRIAASRSESQAALPYQTVPNTEAKPKIKSVGRATRLPDDWQLPDAWKQWAIDAHNLTPQRVVQIALKFKDHWLAAAGMRGCKLRWDSTWRNWVRKECGE
jgi:hypothetical protein